MIRARFAKSKKPSKTAYERLETKKRTTPQNSQAKWLHEISSNCMNEHMKVDCKETFLLTS